MSNKHESFGRPESEAGLKTQTYVELLDRIKNEPHSDWAWERTVELAREEEVSGGAVESYYTKIPLEDLIIIGERLRNAKSIEEKYGVLSEKSPTGEYWYDIVLGHVNDKVFANIASDLQNIKWRKGKIGIGLDVGSGLGNTLRAIAPSFEKVVGVEKNSQLVKEMESNPSMPKNIEVVSGDAIKLPFADETFDVAVSNGLTHYLTRGEMEGYVREISRTLKDKGLYYEAFTIKKPGAQLSLTETEYLTSAKALLVCFIDNMISSVEIGEEDSWDFKDMVDAFWKNGVYYSEDDSHRKERNRLLEKNKGIVVARFVKDKKQQEGIQKELARPRGSLPPEEQ